MATSQHIIEEDNEMATQPQRNSDSEVPSLQAHWVGDAPDEDIQNLLSGFQAITDEVESSEMGEESGPSPRR